MATSPLPSVLVALGAKVPSTEPDSELLSRYVSNQDDAAFALLVRRYSRLVWRVARTRCRTESTAEDVFQATFVVLARKAGSIRTGGALPGWLHRTAYRLAVKAARAERPSVPLVADTPVSADPLDALTARELLVAVDDELARMSDTERSALMLCGVENEAVEDAALRLGCSPGAVKGRLERARAKLRTRLFARGLTVPAILFTLFASPTTASVQAATVTALGGTVPPRIETLLAEGSRMTRRFITAGMLAILVASGIGTGVGLLPRPVTSTANAAPVPKEKGSAVLWSEPVKVDWQASRAERLAGVWTPDGKNVLVPRMMPSDSKETTNHGGIDFRDPDTGKVTKTLEWDGGVEVKGFEFLPQSLAVSPDGKTVYASGSLFAVGGKQAIRGVAMWKDVSKDDPPEASATANPPEAPIALSPDGKQFTTVTGDTVDVRDTTSGKTIWTTRFGRNGGRPTAVVFQPKEAAVLVGGTDGGCAYFDAATGRTLMSVNKLGVEARAVAVSADGKATVFGGKALENGRPLVIVGKEVPADAVPEKVAVNGLAFSPDNKHLAAACSDGELRVFDAETGKPVASVKEHKEAVFSVAYSPNGKRLLSVGKDAVKVWDVEALMKGK